MKLIVGLGNPGKEYQNTRHNIGYMCIDNYIDNHKDLKFKKRFNGLYAKFSIGNEIVILLKPLSFMNLSGIVVKKYIDYFKIDIENILIIHDDLDLPTGKIKIKNNGSSGGHNGIKNIIELLNTNSFSRLKIGISKSNDIDTKDYVLGKISGADLLIINKTLNIVNSIIDDYMTWEIEKLMCKYNGDNNEFNK